MSAPAKERQLARSLARLAAPGAILARCREGAGYGVFSSADRRRRPLARLPADAVRRLAAEGTIAAAPQPGAFVLTAAGRSQLARAAAPVGEAFAAQHGPIEDRSVMDAEGAPGAARGYALNAVLRRLAAMRDPRGALLFTAGELAAAQRLRADWDLSQRGLVRAADWTAPPRGSTPRGPAAAQEALMAARCDARRRLADAIDALAAPLRRAVERVCLHEEGLDALERGENWPARSGKVALKLGLAQLAAHLARRVS